MLASASGGQSGEHTGRRYGILGGTFDPPHVGHLIVAQEVAARLSLDRVWFLPAGTPPHKIGQHISPPADRLAMVSLAVAGNATFGVCAAELMRSGPSYTADTLTELRGHWGPDCEITLILGWDMVAYLPHWHAPERVIAQVNRLAAVHRPGTSARNEELERLESALPGLRSRLIVVPAPQVDVSASDLRVRVASGLPIRYLVPDAVCQYIDERGLYGMDAGVEATW
jgi:nicotinate-nucleotide adenylyltransferase